MPETMDHLKTSIEEIIKSRFPESFLRTDIMTLGGAHRPSLAVIFALGKNKDEWPNHILHNDKAHTVIMVHTKQDENGIISNLELNSNLYGYRDNVTYENNKAGWRDIKKPTDINGVLKNITKYFDNMKELHSNYLASLEPSTPAPAQSDSVQSNIEKLANTYIDINPIDSRTLLATFNKLPDISRKDDNHYSIMAYLTREEANILSRFSKDHDTFYEKLMVSDKNQALDTPKDIRDIARQMQHDSIKLDDKFFKEAFTNPTNNVPYDVPQDFKAMATQICKDNNIKGTCDPMYIANVAAMELGRGNGQSNFMPYRSTASEDIDRLADRLNSAYRSCIIDPESTKKTIMNHLSTHIHSPDDIKKFFKYEVIAKLNSGTEIQYGFISKKAIENHWDEKRKESGKNGWRGYSISENKQESIMKNNNSVDSITRHNVGDKVIITPENLQTMMNGNRSIKAYPSDSYITKVKEVAAQGTEGIITHTFPPGYEVTARFGEQSFHMKDNYITNLSQTLTAQTYPELTKAEQKELADFTNTVKQNFPEARTEDLHRLCNIASDMKKCTVENAKGFMPEEKFNDTTDHQEKQAESIINTALPGAKVRYDYDWRGAAIKLELPQGQRNGLAGYNVPEIPKNKLTLPQDNSNVITPVKKR